MSWQIPGAVRAASSAAEALETVAEFVPDVVVSDIGTPEEDGYWLLKKLRCLTGGKGGKLRAIALTAYAREEDRAMALKAGFDRHLAKPATRCLGGDDRQFEAASDRQLK